MSKTEKDEFRNNIVFDSKNYSMEFTQTAVNAGPYSFRNNLWYMPSKANSIQFKGKATSVSSFQSTMGETGGLSTDPKFTNANSGDFTLASNSPGKNAGDNGYDIGAYPVYGPSGAGWNSAYKFSDVQVYFGSSISSVKRTEQLKLTVKLSKASTETVTVNVTPIAGDAKDSVDFALLKTVSFKPGETSKTVEIQFGGSAKYDELVAFRLTDPENAQVGARRLHAVRVKSGEGGKIEMPSVSETPSDTGTTAIHQMLNANTKLRLKRNMNRFEIEGATEKTKVYVHGILGNRLYSGVGTSSFELKSRSGVVLITVSDPVKGVSHFRFEIR